MTSVMSTTTLPCRMNSNSPSRPSSEVSNESGEIATAPKLSPLAMPVKMPGPLLDFTDQHRMLQEFHHHQQKQLQMYQDFEKQWLMQQQCAVAINQMATPPTHRQFFSHATGQASMDAAVRATARPSLPRQNSFDQGGEGKLSSSQVRQKLKECVLNKKHREMSKSPPSWTSPQNSFDSQDSPPAPTMGVTQRAMRSYPLPGGSIFNLKEDFPLRKTSSEPNLKVRSALKQKVIERRSSPLTKRRVKVALMEKHMNQVVSNGVVAAGACVVGGGSTATSEDGSRNGGTPSPVTAVPGPGGMVLPSHLACPPQLALPIPLTTNPTDPLSLFTSLPNLSLTRGLPPFVPNNSPATASTDQLVGGPGCPLLHSAFSPGQQITVSTMEGSPPISSSSRRSLPKRRHPHPLSRTHSAPLPLGLKPSLQLAVQEQKLLVKAQLRQKVLHRAGSSSSGGGVGEDNGNSGSPQSSLAQIKVREPEEGEEFSPGALGHPPVSVYPRLVDRLGGSPIACLERTNSSPIMKLPSPIQEEKIPEFTYTTALAYELGMLAHQCLCGEDERHPENPTRITAIWQHLQEAKLTARCQKMPGKKATMDDLQLCHEDTYTVLYGTNPANRVKINHQLLMSVNFCRLPCAGVGIDTDTVWNCAHTANAARLAAGCVSELALRVMRKDFRNGFAIVRPPGHHAEIQQAMGFCYFNSVAIATRKLLQEQAATCRRVLIIDWDVHHGNGTQQIFYADAAVLYISLHRHDQGAFFPGTGACEDVGSGAGVGFNMNIGWTSSQPLGDAEYMAAFRHIVLPVANEFAPDLVLVSAGFDAAPGHPPSLGGYHVSPAGYAWMTRQVLQLAEGRVVLALEGGYHLESLCASVEGCIRVLLEGEEASPDPLVPELSGQELSRAPAEDAVATLRRVVELHAAKWTCLRGLDAEKLAQPIGSDGGLPAPRDEETSIPVAAMAAMTVAHMEDEPMEAEATQ